MPPEPGYSRFAGDHECTRPSVRLGATRRASRDGAREAGGQQLPLTVFTVVYPLGLASGLAAVTSCSGCAGPPRHDDAGFLSTHVLL